MAAEQQGKQQRLSQEDIQKAAAATVECSGTCGQATCQQDVRAANAHAYVSVQET